jgi:hypothetical protein
MLLVIGPSDTGYFNYGIFIISTGVPIYRGLPAAIPLDFDDNREDNTDKSRSYTPLTVNIALRQMSLTRIMQTI